MTPFLAVCLHVVARFRGLCGDDSEDATGVLLALNSCSVLAQAAGSGGHSGGSGPHEAAGSDVGSGTGNTPKASHDFNWALGLDLLPHEEGDALFAGIQVGFWVRASFTLKPNFHSQVRLLYEQNCLL